MKEKMKRSELLQLNMVLEQQLNLNEKMDKKFIFAVYRNLEYFAPEIKAIKETQKESSKFQEYQNKRSLIGEEFAERDVTGKPLMENVNGISAYVIKEKKIEANVKLTQLIQEYHEVIEEQKENMRQFEELLNEEIEINICQVPFASVPDNINNFGILRKIIKESNDEIEKTYL